MSMMALQPTQYVLVMENCLYCLLCRRAIPTKEFNNRPKLAMVLSMFCGFPSSSVSEMCLRDLLS